ncbi:MAG: hypothetical protein FD166_2254 [Bacteroidetes bacterium]|nr:MAG: hypothetical protein FD166_2254 [Bacteroidota bacterium]
MYNFFRIRSYIPEMNSIFLNSQVNIVLAGIIFCNFQQLEQRRINGNGSISN